MKTGYVASRKFAFIFCLIYLWGRGSIVESLAKREYIS